MLDAKYDILAWNPLADVLIDLGSRPRDDLNLIRWAFRSPGVAALLDEEERGPSSSPPWPTCAWRRAATPMTRASRR